MFNAATKKRIAIRSKGGQDKDRDLTTKWRLMQLVVRPFKHVKWRKQVLKAGKHGKLFGVVLKMEVGYSGSEDLTWRQKNKNKRRVTRARKLINPIQVKKHYAGGSALQRWKSTTQPWELRTWQGQKWVIMGDNWTKWPKKTSNIVWRDKQKLLPKDKNMVYVINTIWINKTSTEK